MADDDDDDRGGRGRRDRPDRPGRGGGGSRDVAVTGSFFARSVKTYGEKFAKMLGEGVAGASVIGLGYEMFSSIVGVNALEALAPAVTAWVQNPEFVKRWVRGMFADADEAEALLELVDEWIDRAMESLQETLAKRGRLTEADVDTALAGAIKQVEDKLGVKKPYEQALEGCPVATQKALFGMIRAMNEEQRTRFNAYRKLLSTSRGIIQIVELSIREDDNAALEAVALLANLELKYGPPPKKADPGSAIAGAFKKADDRVREVLTPTADKPNHALNALRELARSTGRRGRIR